MGKQQQVLGTFILDIDGAKVNLLVINYVWKGTASMDLPLTTRTRDQSFGGYLPFLAYHAKGCFACRRHRCNGAGIIESSGLL